MQNFIKQHIVLIRYFFIGLSAAALDVLIYMVLYNYINISAVLATTISISIATLYAFFINRSYNFKVKDRTFIRFTLYLFSSFTGWCISATLLYLFTNIYGYNGNLIKIFSLPIIFIIQYLINKNITFKVQEYGITSRNKSSK